MPTQTTEKIVKTHEAVSQLSTADRINKFPWSRATRLRLASVLRKTGPVFDAYVEQKNALVAHLGTTNKDGNYEVLASSPHFKEFSSENRKMLAVQEEFLIEPIPQDDVLGTESKPNNIPVDLIGALLDLGVIAAPTEPKNED